MGKICKITGVSQMNGKRVSVVVENSPFRPSGGGQPGDTGVITGDNFRARVQDCFTRDGECVLDIVVSEGKPSVGDDIKAEPDEKRRFLLSRMHSAEHILSRVLENSHEGLSVFKVDIGEQESVVSMKFDGRIDWDTLFAAENEANAVIEENRKVIVQDAPLSSAKSMKGLKANWDRIESDSVRVVSMENFDLIACSGSHVTETSEVGSILVTGFKGSPPQWSVRFTVDSRPLLWKWSRTMRRLMRETGTECDKLPALAARLQDDAKKMQRDMDRAKKYMSLPWEERDIGKCRFFVLRMENFPVELAMPSIRRKTEEHPDALVLFISAADGEKTRFVMAKGDSSTFDPRAFLQSSGTRLGAKGGGDAGAVRGVAGSDSLTEWQNEIMSFCHVDKR